MALHETYCSVSFLEQLYSQLKRSDEEYDDDFSAPEHLHNLKKLILRYSDLILDIPEQEILDRSLKKDHPMFNPSLKKLWKDGRQHFVSIPKTFEQMKTDEDYFKGKTTELYFIDEKDRFCINIRNSNGIQCLNFSQFPKFESEIFDISTILIRKGEFSDIWEIFNNICPPTNSMVIVDQFLINGKESKELNLFPMLESLLPPSLDFPYDLAIFISDDSNQRIDVLYEEIKTFLANKFSYKVNLTVLHTKKSKIHDRCILSNRYLIDSGHGFDLIRAKNGKTYFIKDTKISFYPITLLTRAPKNLKETDSVSNALSDWKILVEAYGGIFKNTLPATGKNVNIMGSGTHRLLK